MSITTNSVRCTSDVRQISYDDRAEGEVLPNIRRGPLKLAMSWIKVLVHGQSNLALGRAGRYCNVRRNGSLMISLPVSLRPLSRPGSYSTASNGAQLGAGQTNGGQINAFIRTTCRTRRLDTRVHSKTRAEGDEGHCFEACPRTLLTSRSHSPMLARRFTNNISPCSIVSHHEAILSVPYNPGG